MKFENINEDNFSDVVKAMFPSVNIIDVKEFIHHDTIFKCYNCFELDGQQYIVNFKNDLFYTNSRLQVWEQLVTEMCADKNIKFINIPHFVNLDHISMMYYFGHDVCEKYKPHENIHVTDRNGFDTMSICPANYNKHGVDQFTKEYTDFISGQNDFWPICKKIYNDIHDSFEEIDFLGIDPSHELRMIWIHYPT